MVLAAVDAQVIGLEALVSLDPHPRAVSSSTAG
jgi:hypothetical protein